MRIPQNHGFTAYIKRWHFGCNFWKMHVMTDCQTFHSPGGWRSWWAQNLFVTGASGHGRREHWGHAETCPGGCPSHWEDQIYFLFMWNHWNHLKSLVRQFRSKTWVWSLSSYEVERLKLVASSFLKQMDLIDVEVEEAFKLCKAMKVLKPVAFLLCNHAEISWIIVSQ